MLVEELGEGEEALEELDVESRGVEAGERSRC
jgi:hypothetical protein